MRKSLLRSSSSCALRPALLADSNVTVSFDLALSLKSRHPMLHKPRGRGGMLRMLCRISVLCGSASYAVQPAQQGGASATTVCLGVAHGAICRPFTRSDITI